MSTQEVTVLVQPLHEVTIAVESPQPAVTLTVERSGPQGPTGATGATGAQGPQGETGPAGSGGGGGGSSDWADITNKPSTFTPTTHAHTEADITGLTADLAAKYVLPGSGIPKTDLAATVQTSLGLADTALQSAPVTSVASKTGAVTLAASDVGLGNVDNTSDATKNAAAVTLTNKTLSSPKTYLLLNYSGQVGFGVSGVSSGAATYVSVDCQASGTPPEIWGWSSTDSNVSLNLRGKGTGVILANNVPVLTRSVTTINTTTTIGSTRGTDYIVFIAANGAPTLPTAVNNTNRYTLKNIDTATKTVTTTSSQTIDGSTTITLRQDQSVDLVSDGANWRLI